MFKSERQQVFINGGPETGVTKLQTPDGTFELENGRGAIMLTRTKSDIPLKVVCPSGDSKQIILETRYDWLVGGVLNVLNYGIGWIIDPFNGSSYIIDDNVTLMSQCKTENLAH